VSSWSVSPKHGGETAAASVIELVADLETVPDTEATHYDAQPTAEISAHCDLELAEVDTLDPATPVEIKTVMVVQTECQQRGRFNLRKGQHEALLADDGVYLFAVCEPTPSRDILAIKSVPATVVEDRRSDWRTPDGRLPYTQLAWSRLIDPDSLGEEGR
jgi:hypothetical protein